MKLTNEQLKSIYYGALHFRETEDGYLQAFQYTDAQMEYFRGAFDFWYDRCMATTAKTLEFTTDATQCSFEYKIVWIGSEDTVELWVDEMAAKIDYVKNLGKEGTLTFTLPEGEKKVVIYLPADATMWVRNFEINGAVTPVEKKEKVLWMGDSITQGFGPLRSAHTYVSVANRLLKYDILNQGIGGYVYDKNALVPMAGYVPEKIIIAMGTNQFGDATMQAVEEYYERLKEVYGEIPVLCVTPIWRGDRPEGMDTLVKFCENIKKICAKYPNITVVDGFKLVPHLEEYFLDKLHPNALGMELYGRNLVEEIQKNGF